MRAKKISVAAELGSNWFQRTCEKGLDAEVRFNEQLPTRYTNVEKAIRSKTQSSVLFIEANPTQVNAFKDFWVKMPRKYNRFFYNCSTICYDAFRESGLLGGWLCPPVTPEKLYAHISERFKNNLLYKLVEKSGFIGIEKDPRSADT